jgi:hypothetical protein
MTKKLELKLQKKYPKIFKDLYGEPSKTNMAFGIECGDGWYRLIDALCGYIAFNVRVNNMPSVTATQIKEKYGRLCFYYIGGNDHIDGAVCFAEYLSGLICELCGNPGSINSREIWLSCRCKKCMDKL